MKALHTYIPWRDSISRPITPEAETLPLNHAARTFQTSRILLDAQDYTDGYLLPFFNILKLSQKGKMKT
jgi:hypothetical protein